MFERDIIDVATRRLPEKAMPPVTLRDIMGAVSEETGLDKALIVHEGRVRKCVTARRLAAYLAREHTPHSYPKIANWLGRSDHSTSMFYVNTATKLVAKGGDFAAMAHRVEARLGV